MTPQVNTNTEEDFEVVEAELVDSEIFDQPKKEAPKQEEPKTSQKKGKDKKESARRVRESAEEMITNPSIEGVKNRWPDHPEYIETIQKKLEAIDVRDPMSVARIGSDTLSTRAIDGIKMLEEIQTGPSTEAVDAIKQFNKDLHATLLPLEARLRENGVVKEEKTSAIALVTAGISDALSTFALTPKGRQEKKQKQEDRKYEKKKKGLEDSGDELAGVVVDTMTKAEKVNALITKEMEVPTMMDQKIKEAIEIQETFGRNIYLDLVVVCELKKTLLEEIGEREEQSDDSQNSVYDEAYLQREAEKNALSMVFQKETQMKAAFLDAYNQTSMLFQLGLVNAKTAIQLTNLQATALPQLVGSLSVLNLQQRTCESSFHAEQVHQIVAETTEATTDGFRLVLAQTLRTEEAQRKASLAMVAATRESIKALEDYRQADAKRINEEVKVQAQIKAAFVEAQAHSARLGPNALGTGFDAKLLPSAEEMRQANEVAQKTTGYSLEEAGKDPVRPTNGKKGSKPGIGLGGNK
ncbi:MAG: hypothetical protein PHE27_01340 [Alphaproteobacteria bacterium]|nr:hypothetical protein [Alphaproteobacteria bacterium]